MAFHPRGIVTLTDCVVSLWIGIMRASIAHIVCGWFLATCTRYAVMPRGASGFSGSINSSPTYSRRFDDPLFDLTREAILRAFRSMVTLRLFAHVEFTSRNMFDVCHWFPKRSDDSRTRASVTALMEALAAIESQIARLDEQLRELARRSRLCWRLMSVPGVGPIVALAFMAARRDGGLAARDTRAGVRLDPLVWSIGRLPCSLRCCAAALAADTRCARAPGNRTVL